MREAVDHDPNEEFHHIIVEILVKLVGSDDVSTDELRWLCMACGVSTNELMPVDHSANRQEVPPSGVPF